MVAACTVCKGRPSDTKGVPTLIPCRYCNKPLHPACSDGGQGHSKCTRAKALQHLLQREAMSRADESRRTEGIEGGLPENSRREPQAGFPEKVESWIRGSDVSAAEPQAVRGSGSDEGSSSGEDDSSSFPDDDSSSSVVPGTSEDGEEEEEDRSPDVAMVLGSLEFSPRDYYEGCVAAVRTPRVFKKRFVDTMRACPAIACRRTAC